MSSQTWHLPIDPDRQTNAGLIRIAPEATGRTIGYTMPPRPASASGG